MKITILSLSQVKTYKPETKRFKRTALIRIGDTLDELESIDYQYDAQLKLTFYDISPRVGLPSNWNWFNKTNGERLLSFFEDIQAFGFNELVIHCHAGISRSPAVALSYAWFSGNEELEQEIIQGDFIPNEQVLKIMSKLLGIYTEKKELIKSFKLHGDENYTIEF